MDFSRFLHRLQRQAHIQGLHWSRQIETQSPWLARQLLGYASELLEPATFGMGLKIRQWSDERVWVSLPARLKNREVGGELNHGALVSAAEFTLRLALWRTQLVVPTQIAILGSQAQLHSVGRDEVWCRLQISANEREDMRLDLLKLGVIERKWSVHWLQPSGIHLGSVEFRVQLSAPKVMTGA